MSTPLPETATGPSLPDQPATLGATQAYDGAASSSSVDPLIGTQFGRYTLLQKLGEGGMGTVYLAEKVEPVKRKVALKLIRGGLDSRTILARFEAERQALALMNHPHIARIYDGGLASPFPHTLHSAEEPSPPHQPASWPYFVMELVQGVPITTYCDAQRLTPRERLELFIPICQAVQHAHQKGIIHRDLKPSNVLVTVVDGKPVSKIIDFGVAKATEQPLTDESLGDTGAIVGTPMYMSPEQADPSSMDIDTRTDIYALGVMLYELLTGSTPIEARQFRRGALLEVLRMVREVDPPRPSTKLSTAEGLPSIAANRSLEPKQLQAMMRGDMDWIVMKALEKDRTRRYETANGFAADVQRYLSGEAVLAHPPSQWYRVKKFVKRHWVPVIAAGFVLLALVGGVIGTTIGYYRADRAAVQERLAKEEEARQRKRAVTNERLAEDRLMQVEAAQRRTEEEKNTALAVRDFLYLQLLGQADVTAQANANLKRRQFGTEVKENPTIRELLDRAAAELEPERIEISFPKQPLLQAELLQIVGDTYRGIGGKQNDRYALVIRFLQRALSIRQEHLGIDHPATLTNMNNLAGAYSAAGQFAKAVRLHEETLDHRKALQGINHPSTLTCMNNLATLYLETGHLDKALPLYEETLRHRKATLGIDHPDTLTSMSNLAIGYKTIGKVDQVLPLMEETVKLMKTSLGDDHPHTLSTQANLASIYQDLGQHDKALPMLQETVERMKKKLGVNHPSTLNYLNNLATYYYTAKQYDKALPLLEETFTLTRAKLGDDHPVTLNCMNNLAMTYSSAGQTDKALPLLEKTLQLTRAKLGDTHPDTLSSMGNLAAGYRAVGQLPKALPLFEDTLKATKAKLGADHTLTLNSMNNLAIVYWDNGQLGKAIPLLEDTLQRTRAKWGSDHPETLQSTNTLGKAYVESRQRTKAVPLFKEYVAASRKRFSKNPTGLAGLLAQVAFEVMKCDQFSLAEEMLRESLAIREKSEPDAWTTFNTHSMLGGALLSQKKYAEAEPLLLKGYAGIKAHLSAPGADAARLAMQTRLAETLDRNIKLYTETNKPDEVKKWQAEKAKLPKPEEKKN